MGEEDGKGGEDVGLDGSGEAFPFLCECRACVPCACCDAVCGVGSGKCIADEWCPK